jgi:GntR family transcriptional regulator
VDFDTKIPIYLQIMDRIKKDIISGRLQRGDKMPSVRALASELQVNVNTIQRVYQELEREEVVFTQRGIGSFITEDEEIVQRIKQEMAYEILESFVQGMRELGYDSETTLVALKEYMEVKPEWNY